MHIWFNSYKTQVIRKRLVLLLINEDADSHVGNTGANTVDLLKSVKHLKNRLFTPDTPSIPLKISGWVTIIIVFRDVIIVIGAALTLFLIVNWEVKPIILGKMNTVSQFFLILYVTIANLLISLGKPVEAFTNVLNILAYITLILTIISGLLYLRSGAVRLLKFK